nr:HAMP domain-containing sensor histidine kinase [Sedimentibacter sp.]
MNIFRNKEIKYLFLIVFILFIFEIAAICIFSIIGGIMAAVFSIATILVLFFYTKWRYEELDRLSEYLNRTNNGDYSLDLRNNEEGELSILKSEIYKVSVTLREQNSALMKERLNLVSGLSDISHQIKTPLTSMFVLTDSLRDSKLPEEKRLEFIKVINSQLERMQWLVTSLLKMSKLDAKAVEFNKQEILAKTLIEKACMSLLIPIELKNQKLIIDCDDVLVNCDLNWTAEALVNIIKNCVEHTPQSGQIYICSTDNLLYTQISIKDNGIGIDKDDLPHVFNRFYKGKNSSDDSVGIGLAMAKSIITSQEGSINILSKKGEGTEFIIRLFK